MDDLSLYTACSHRCAGMVIKRYSSSFSLATALLPKPVAKDIASIYALVRVADEIVDGTAAAANLNTAEIAAQLDALENDVNQAFASGFSTNLIVHAYADVHRRCHIPSDLTTAFFASMRLDLDTLEHSSTSLATYIYGSAEVIGLMCLYVFFQGTYRGEDAELNRCAQKLGAAFQKINFLRDLADDHTQLHRTYFPALVNSDLNEAIKQDLLQDINQDLSDSIPGLWRLPTRIRISVGAAHDLFAALNDRMQSSSAEQILRQRIRLTDLEKSALVAKATVKYLKRSPL